MIVEPGQKGFSTGIADKNKYPGQNQDQGVGQVGEQLVITTNYFFNQPLEWIE